MSSRSRPSLTILPDEFVINRFPADIRWFECVNSCLARWISDPQERSSTAASGTVDRPPWLSVTWADGELSVVTSESLSNHLAESLEIDDEVIRRSSLRRMLMVDGPLPLEWVGILAGLTQVLAGAEVSVFCLATYDTDYLLVECSQFDLAVQTLRHAGYQVK